MVAIAEWPVPDVLFRRAALLRVSQAACRHNRYSVQFGTSSSIANSSTRATPLVLRSLPGRLTFVSQPYY
ncbi:hypothetical protein GCM10022207_84770 [Streptomyces lannensis]|uniref:Uncharacterized protein n=1 Tax=Streptomyces lannensis TaxID=766498 RepID=A0ABP7LP49_9ACTN